MSGAHHGKRRAHDMKCTAQMDIDHGVEVLVGHLFQGGATNIARIVDKDVDAAIVTERRVDDRLAARSRRHRFGAGDGLATRRRDLADHLVRGMRVGAVSGEVGAGVINDDLGSPGCQ